MGVDGVVAIPTSGNNYLWPYVKLNETTIKTHTCVADKKIRFKDRNVNKIKWLTNT